MANGSPLIALERNLYIGNTLCGLLVGAYTCICLQSIYHLRHSRLHKHHKQFFIAYSVVMLLATVISFAAIGLCGRYLWIDGNILKAARWIGVMVGPSLVVTVVLSDGLLLYRVFIIFGKSVWAVILPSFIYLAATSLGIATVVKINEPNNILLSGRASKFSVTAIILSAVFNILVTIMISVRLLWAQHNFRKHAVESKERTYTGVVAILVESACPLAISGLIAAILDSQKHPVTYPVAVVWAFFVVASPQLIILRVAKGKAWSSSTMTAENETTIQFQVRSSSHDIEASMEHIPVSESESFSVLEEAQKSG
ncbi:hypothetical protein CPB83DRAFT_814802 [Crepidotus variabilis]|uniref:Uncharacterized protein n=1 Tax=Crepidotus variabilis TaxID=179855 RepID=A0A9P6EFG5_9AGAR|nr:hypothetical protein CPB83DRAFT_814802 [Crepidotus variabilis]